MVLIIQRRAEIALRSLQTTDRKRVERALQELTAVDRSELPGNPSLNRSSPSALASTYSSIEVHQNFVW
jgi:hypothetical protein